MPAKPQDTAAADKPKGKRTKPAPAVEPAPVVEPTTEISEQPEQPEEVVTDNPEDAAAVDELLRETEDDDQDDDQDEPTEPAEEAEDEPAEDAEPVEPTEEAQESGGEEEKVRAELLAMSRRELGAFYRRAVRRKLKASLSKPKAVEQILKALAR